MKLNHFFQLVVFLVCRLEFVVETGSTVSISHSKFLSPQLRVVNEFAISSRFNFILGRDKNLEQCVDWHSTIVMEIFTLECLC